MTCKKCLPSPLVIVAAVLGLVLLTAVFSIYLDERDTGILTSPELTELKAKLADDPNNDDLKQQIRVVDQEFRRDYFTNRRQLRLAGYALLGLLITLILWSRHRFENLSTLPDFAALIQNNATPTEKSLKAAACVGVLVFVVLLGGALLGRGELPPEGWTPAMMVAEAAEAAPPLFTQNWPGFRGEHNLGIANDGDYPTTWSMENGVNILWTAEVPIKGKSSPVVWGERVFVSGATDLAQHVMCFDRKTGDLLWNKRVVARAEDEEFDPMEDTGFAAPTPVTDGERVFAMFAAGILAAFDNDGNQLWVKNLGLPDSIYGFATSLLLAEGRVILQFDVTTDGEEGNSHLIAYDPVTGQEAWNTQRMVPNSWASPALVTTEAGSVIVTCADPWVIAYNPTDGQEVWRVEGLSGDVAPSPAFGAGLIFITNDMAKLMAIRPGGSGDVTETHVVWESEDGMPDIASPITDGKFVLQVFGSDLTCFDIESGELLWDHYLESSCSASPIVAGDTIYLSAEDGVTYIFKMTAEGYEAVGQGDLGEPVYATAAFADSQLYFRGSKHLVCGVEE